MCQVFIAERTWELDLTCLCSLCFITILLSPGEIQKHSCLLGFGLLVFAAALSGADWDLVKRAEVVSGACVTVFLLWLLMAITGTPARKFIHRVFSAYLVSSGWPQGSRRESIIEFMPFKLVLNWLVRKFTWSWSSTTVCGCLKIQDTFSSCEMPYDCLTNSPVSAPPLLDHVNSSQNMAWIADIKDIHSCDALLPSHSTSPSYLDLHVEEEHMSKNEWEKLA